MDSSDESDIGESMLQMVEEDDLKFLKKAVENRSYKVLNKIKFVGNKRKRTSDDSEDFENNYEAENTNNPEKKLLLPIKTKNGIIKRAVKIEDVKEEENDDEDETEKLDDVTDLSDADDFEFNEDSADSKPKDSIGILAKYNESLRNKKVHIGYLCSSLLENPEEKVVNFRTLLKMLDDDSLDAALSIKKLLLVSIAEVFKDILPSYQIRHQDTKEVKLKKETLRLNKYEEALLQYYKKFLQRLEKLTKALVLKGNKAKNEDIKLGEISLQALCSLLIVHPYFNYSVNIVQTTVPFLNHRNPSVRQMVNKCYVTIFNEDKKEEITLKIMRGINLYIKSHAHNVHPDMLEVLLHLKIKNINLDDEKEKELKQKKLESHRQNVLQLSKKERKRKKRLKELEKEMLEVKAEENKQNKQKNLTEITKIVFGILFRILKSSKNNKILGICLEGLAKYAHCINLEYYMDLLNVLNSLIKEDWLTYRDQLHCIQTAFAILTGQGEIINIDPTRFYNSIYANLLAVDAGKSYRDCDVLLKTVADAVVKRQRKITKKQQIGFVKRLATLSLQLLHNGSLSALALMKLALQQNKSIDILLDVDTTVGDGDYNPEVNDPEYCNASSTALYELTLLRNHYHPIVSKYAQHLAAGVPISGEGSLPIEYAKLAPDVLYSEFDMSEMAFNPAIPPPKKKMKKLGD